MIFYNSNSNEIKLDKMKLMKQKLCKLKQKANNNQQKYINKFLNVVKCSLRSEMGLNHLEDNMSPNKVFSRVQILQNNPHKIPKN